MADDTTVDDVAAPDGNGSEPAAAPGPEVRHGALVGRFRGQAVLHPTRETYLQVVTALSEEGFDLCADLCVADYLSHGGRTLPEGIAPERFEVVVNMLSMSRKERVRVRVQVPEGEPTIASLFELFPGTEAMEREAWDMFGIVFEGHPDLTRILMPEDWEGHPLRKDYPVGRIPVQFKATRATSGGR